MQVLKWDERGNDIIVLAKQMCVIMMEMTDFTRGRGPLTTTMAIIGAAKKISDCGGQLDKLARDIAEACPESQSKRELDAYLKPIPLFCNQLNIASKVKANVIDVSGEPMITGLDSATSLIISAKNLMTAVVSVVKASYVASTKYSGKSQDVFKVSSLSGMFLKGLNRSSFFWDILLTSLESLEHTFSAKK